MKLIKTLIQILLGAVCAVLSGVTFAHHSNAEYDRSTLHEIEGEIVSVRWRNPHVAFEVATTNGDGDEVIWDFEALAVSALNRRAVTGEQLQVGDSVRVTGFSREPRWSSTAIGTESGVLDPAQVAIADGDGIFRVWSRDTGTWYFRSPDQYPVTAEAGETAADWNDLEDNPLLRCEPPGMPALMGNPYPMEFIDRDDVIEIRFEEFDAVREIHLDGELPSDQPHSPMGYSTGYWEGSTLIVSTSRINWPFFNRVGIRQTEAVEISERFQLTDSDETLLYELTVTDPGTLTEPYVWNGRWIWRPGEVVSRYDCTLEE
jgi:hypothetical protein